MANATKRGPPDEDTDDESQEEDVYRGDGPSSPDIQKKHRTNGPEGAPNSQHSILPANDPIVQLAVQARDLGEMSHMQEALQKDVSSRSRRRNKTASGTIKKIYLENFMCHERLSFDFGANMNFIIGHNGSGKSAILTALTIVLGGKASSTGRGSGMTDLIRSGAAKAVVRAVLKNDGEDPYKPEIWGHEITIERFIAKEGTSGWKARSALDGDRAKPRSTIRETIVTMMDFFDIQVDNPMTVLSQDMSRAFLSTSDSHKKYELFLKGTRLKKLADGYEEIDAKINSISANMERQSDGLEARRMERDKWRKRREEMNAIEDKEKEVENLQKDLAWATVRDKEKDVQDLREEFARLDEALRQATEKADNFTETAVAASDLVTQAEEAERQFQAANGHIAEELKEIVTEQKKLVEAKSDQSRALQNLVASVQARDRQIKDLEAQRDEEIRKSGHAGFAEKQQELRNQKKELSAKILKIQTQLPMSEQKQREAKSVFEAGRDALRQIEEEQQQAEIRVTQCQNALNAATREQAGQGQAILNRYGQNIQAVFDEINKTRWEVEKPIGPLGIHCKIQKGQEKYIKVIESAIGIQLVSWAVRSPRDRQTLNEIFRHCQRQYRTTFETGKNDRSALPPILTHSGDIFNYSQGDESRRHQTVLSSLEIDNEQVVRLLINSNSIEKILVEPTRRMADETARSRTRNGQSVSVLTADMFRVLGTASGGQSSTPLSDWAGSSMLSTDLKAAIEARMIALREAEQQVQEIANEKRKREESREQSSEAVNKAEKSVAQLHSWQREYKRKIQQLDQQLAEEEPMSVTTYTEEIARVTEDRRQEDEQCVGLNEQLQATTALVNEIKNRREEVRVRRDNFNSGLEKHAKAVSEARARKDELSKGQRNLVATRAKRHEVLEAKRPELAKQELTLTEWTDKASRFCPDKRFPTDTVDRIKRRKEAAEKAVAKGTANFKYTSEEVNKNFNEAAARYHESTDKVRDVREALKWIKTALDTRKGNWSLLRQDISIQTKDLFKEYLKVRGFDGQLILDHATSKLDMDVSTEMVGESTLGMAKDARALSGGETSFTTLCLILAIWGNVKSPLRCLDEFDVFMDAENRKLAMSLLIRVATGADVTSGKSLSRGQSAALARNGDGRQYILITPQEMSGAKLPVTVKVLRMRDPERGQTRLTASTD